MNIIFKDIWARCYYLIFTLSSFLNWKHFFWGLQKFTTVFPFSRVFWFYNLLRYCMTINAIHVTFKEAEKLRLKFCSFKKTLQFKNWRMVILCIWVKSMSNLSLISLNVYITLYFSKSTHFVRKIDFFSVENCEPLLLSSENIFIAFYHMLAILLGTENPVVRGHLNQWILIWHILERRLDAQAINTKQTPWFSC